jgi:hypothetical protein
VALLSLSVTVFAAVLFDIDTSTVPGQKPMFVVECDEFICVDVTVPLLLTTSIEAVEGFSDPGELLHTSTAIVCSTGM